VPLPEGGNTAWPPRQLDPVFARIDSWDAWYTGDPDHLADIYGTTYAHGFDTTSRNRLTNHPSQYRGGVVGRIARWFWGTPIPLGEQRAKLHIPLASDIAAKSSKLLFAEPPTFKAAKTSAQDRLDTLLGHSFRATLLEAGEVCAGLGGVYLRAMWDSDISDKPWMHPNHADTAVPEWKGGRLRACTFWRVLEDDGNRVVRHLERHEPGAILHGLYEGTADKLGQKIPLNEHTETDEYTELVEDGDRIETLIKDLTVRYVPNMRPNKYWRKIPAACELGRADIAGAEPMLDALDEVWTSLLRDIRLAKGRVIVPDAYLQNNGPGMGATFDAEREVYSALSMLPHPGSQTPITVAQFAIRFEEHLGTARELSQAIVQDCGYSGETFGFQTQGGLKTATEVAADQEDTYLTRGHKTLYWSPALVEMSSVLLQLDNAHFGGTADVEEPDIEWPDGVAEDLETIARTVQLLDAAAAVSTRTKVEMVHQDWDKVRIDEEVKAIEGRPVENPDTFTGGQIVVNRPQQTEDEQGAGGEQPEA
jgi:hypothetical protein